MAVTNSKAFPLQLDKTINKIWLNYLTETKREYEQLAKISSAPAGGSIVEAEMGGLGLLAEIDEGAGITFDNPVEGTKKTRTYKVYGLGFQVL